MIDRLQQLYTDLTDESAVAFARGKSDAINGKPRNAGKGALNFKRIAKDYVTSGGTTEGYLAKYNEGYTLGLQLKEGLPELQKTIQSQSGENPTTQTMEESLSYIHQRQLMVSLSETLEEFTKGLELTLDKYSEQVAELVRAGMEKDTAKRLYHDLNFLEEQLNEISQMVKTKNQSQIERTINTLDNLIREQSE